MMTTKSRILVAAALAASVGAASLGLAVSPADAKGKCVLAGGEATMITEDLARFMANAALNNQIKANNMKASGAVKMTCKSTVGTHCVARQRACS